MADPIRVGEATEVTVRALAAGGAGVADLPDGRVVFVPRTAPGDRVRVRLTRVRSRWATGRVEEVLEPAPERVEPPCPLYGACGGCTLQHVAYDDQRAWKGRWVEDALARIGGMHSAPDRVVPSPDPLGYRNRLTLTLRRLGGGRVCAGFHGAGRPGFVVDVPDCLLAEDPVREAWKALREGWGGDARLLPPDRTLRLTLRHTDSGVTLLVGGGRAGWDPEPLGRATDAFALIWHQPRGDRRPLRVWGPQPGEEPWLGDAFPVRGRAFLQVNRRVAAELKAFVLARAGSGRTALDAYCGVGVYGRELARAGWRVTGLETDADACVAARHHAPGGFDVVEGAVEEHLSRHLPSDLVILNPPRTGLHPEVPGILAGSPVGRIVYVSCDPATLARDARLLGSRYRLEGVRAFDLFPQSAHVETVATLVPREES